MSRRRLPRYVEFPLAQVAVEFLNLLQSPHALAHIANDLRRWLPLSWPVDAASAAAMAGTAVAALDHGIESMREVRARPGGHP